MKVNERVFVVINGVPSKYLGPGRHRVFAWFDKVSLERISTVNLLADLDASRLALVPAEDLAIVTNAADQRAVVYRKGKAALWLGAGVHQVWTVDRVPLIKIASIDVSGVETQPLKDDVRAIAPAADYVQVTVPAGSVALRFVNGTLDAELPPGRHAAFTAIEKVSFAVIDLKERLLHVSGQEVMTRDRVSLRLNVSAAFKVTDAKRLATVARNPDDVLYLAMQLAARDAVSSRSLDELLAARE